MYSVFFLDKLGFWPQITELGSARFGPENGIPFNIKIIAKWSESRNTTPHSVFGERETGAIAVVYNQRALSSHNSCMRRNSSGLSLAGKKLHQQATKTTTFHGPSGVG